MKQRIGNPQEILTFGRKIADECDGVVQTSPNTFVFLYSVREGLTDSQAVSLYNNLVEAIYATETKVSEYTTVSIPDCIPLTELSTKDYPHVQMLYTDMSDAGAVITCRFTQEELQNIFR